MEPVELKLGGFSLLVYGRESPDSDDYWDGNWLLVRARVEAHRAFVEAEGSFLHAPELANFMKELEVLHATLVGEAVLRCMEPNLEIAIESKSLGHMEVRVMLTPDNMTQSHNFTFDLDQSYLGPVLDGCRRVLLRWPIRANT